MPYLPKKQGPGLISLCTLPLPIRPVAVINRSRKGSLGSGLPEGPTENGPWLSMCPQADVSHYHDGHLACPTQCSITEPSSMPTKAPCPLLPTTSISAPFAVSTKVGMVRPSITTVFNLVGRSHG